MRVRQRIFPKPAENATTSPSSPRLPPAALHGGRFMNVWKTVPWSTAGDAATQRCERYFHAGRPVSALIAFIRPLLDAKKSRPYAITGGNSRRLRAPFVQTRLNGGRRPRPSTARVRSGTSPYVGH